MTEEEWLAATDPRRLLSGLPRKGSPRRLRLLACACCRLLWPLVRDPRSRHAVEVAERHAEGFASDAELLAAREEASAALEELPHGGGPGLSPEEEAACACAWAADGSIVSMAEPCATTAAEVLAHQNPPGAAEHAGMCGLIRDLFGNPFRPVRVTPSWLSWNRGTVVTMAGTIYREGTFADLPVLADALEDAGCADADILAHCRNPGEHVRGCWVLDLLLGKFPAGITIDAALEDKVAAFVRAFESVFDRDWAYTRDCLGIGAGGNGKTTFLNTGLTEEEESEDWGSRGALLETYRELKRTMTALGISESRPRDEER